MILLFGGTTEGRKAAKELEEAGKCFYYSTKTGEQDIALQHGVRIDGALDEQSMADFCIDNGIRIIVDAAHPFAKQLHQTVAAVAERLSLDAIRFERIFPERDSDITWIDDFTDIPRGINTLLATTGVQTISRLKYLEERGVKVFYRILPRESSIRLAHRNGATDDQLCYYSDDEDEKELMSRLGVDALLLKESGMTGGFLKKVEAARSLGLNIIALRRPATPPIFRCVNGEHGLRRVVEELLPDFFPLRSGLTTGTYATAASLADATHKLLGETPSEVPVRLPNGETIPVAVAYTDNYAYTIKVSGDDPDVTNGIEIRGQIELSDRFMIKGGKGIGTITLPGFDFPPGEPAINRVPRKMIEENLSLLVGRVPDFKGHLAVTISVPNGEEIARKTFNPRLGIEGGISIVGVSGIIKPFSEEAFVDSIRRCMEVAKAGSPNHVVINSGAKSERFVKALHPELPLQAFVEYGNYIGETLKIADDLQISHVTLGVMMGKAVKLAAGNLDTHSKKVTMDKDFISAMLREAGCDDATLERAEKMTLARELWDIIPEESIQAFCNVMIRHCIAHCKPLLPSGILTILLIDDNGRIYEYV